MILFGTKYFPRKKNPGGLLTGNPVMKTDRDSVFNERETRSHKSKATHIRKYVHTYALQVQVDMIMCFLLPLYYQTFMDHPKIYTIFFFYCMIMLKSKFYFPQPSYFERSEKNLNPNLSKEIGQFIFTRIPTAALKWPR